MSSKEKENIIVAGVTGVSFIIAYAIFEKRQINKHKKNIALLKEKEKEFDMAIKECTETLAASNAINEETKGIQQEVAKLLNLD